MKRILYFIALLLAGSPALAQPGAAVDSLEIARQKIFEADYDAAIEILDSQVRSLKPNWPRLRQAYLLQIFTHVLNSNALRDMQQTSAGRSEMDAARGKVYECLRIWELRTTEPSMIEGIPQGSIPPAVTTLFRDARQEIFGGIRITAVDPPETIVLLDSDTLGALPDGVREDLNLALGPHIVILQAEGYQTLTENITVEAGVTTSRELYLKRKKGPMWYVTRGGVLVAMVVGGAFLASGGGEEEPEPLPGPPAPPN